MDAVVLTAGNHRVFYGAPWIFRTEVASADAQPGSVVMVTTPKGRVVGQGFYNPRSMIAVRMVWFGAGGRVDGSLWRHRVIQALAWRRRLAADRQAFRVIHSEADGIPGLVVDKYGPMLVVQVTSLGLLPYMDGIVETLVETLHPDGVYEEGDLSVREREGLPRENRLLWGRMVSPIEVQEHQVRFLVDVVHGQKTGHFLDQYANRGVVGELAEGLDVFDAFCHTGGFGLTALVHGARSLVGIDIDEKAIDRARDNAELNGVQDRAEFVAANAFDWLRRQSDQKAQYDLGILDPPAFTKAKSSLPQAIKGYKEINLRGIKLMRPGGVLITSSCSYHLSEADFIAVVQAAAYDAKRQVRILQVRGQGLDHPIAPALPESRYLKCLVLGVD